ncbi:hypothetical protein, partial [Pseudomonas putida]|uniref:hypothetical protein n=1 Tax=Pseudomonas putida TaxID=303 RepID=UPI001EE3F961
SAKDICFIGTQPFDSCEAGISPNLEAFFRVSLKRGITALMAILPLPQPKLHNWVITVNICCQASTCICWAMGIAATARP